MRPSHMKTLRIVQPTEEKEMQQKFNPRLPLHQDGGPPAGLLSIPPGGNGSINEAFDISHELRTSLAVITLISGNLDRLYERLDDGQRRKMIQDIRKHTHRLNSVISDILTLPADCDPLSA